VIKGENPEKTVLDIGDNSIIFVSENGTDGISSNFNSSDKPHDIVISNLTIDHEEGQTVISAARDCIFDNVRWLSNYVLGQETFVPTNPSAIYNSPVTSSGGRFVITVFSTTFAPFLFDSSHLQTLNSMANDLNNESVFNSFFEAEVVGSSFIIRTKSNILTSDYIDDNIVFFVERDNVTAGEIVSPILEEFKDGSESVNASVYWENQSFGVATTKNLFRDCSFTFTPLATECRQTLVFDTEIEFDRCNFFTNDTAIYVNGVQGQGNSWTIKDCLFERIANQAVLMTNGIGTQVTGSKFKNCGNGNNESSFPLTSVVKFGEKFNNIVINCSSDRHQASAITSNSGSFSVVEFENVSKASLVDRNYSLIYYSEGFRPLCVLPAKNRFIIIDYFLSLGNPAISSYSRIGQIFITVGDDISGDINETEVAISDNYIYSPSTPSSPGGSYMTNFEFAVDLLSNTTLDDSTQGPNLETIILYYKNPSGSAIVGNIGYSITYGV
jgi:hypothetical protein